MGFTVIPFFSSLPFIQLYRKVAHFGAGIKQGISYDSTHQCGQLHHMAERLLSVRYKLQEMPHVGSCGLHCSVCWIYPRDCSDVCLLGAEANLQAEYSVHHHHAGACTAYDLHLIELQGQGRLFGTRADGSVRCVPVLDNNLK